MARRSLIIAPLIAALLMPLVLAGPVGAANPTLRSKVAQSGLQNPWDVAFAPDGQMFVTERPGRVRVYNSGGAGAPLLATTTLAGVRAEGESGAMGIAVDPFFASNRFVYVCVSRMFDGQWLNQLIRYRVTGKWRLQHRRNIIARGMRANTIHNGCAVEIGPDNKLWVTMGDANNPALAQNPTAKNGKVLRLNRDGSVPGDNPIMPGANKRTIVYSMGHRNPQGIAFHPWSDRVYVVEHGPDRSDEINLIRPGRNYGWPCVTGRGNPYHGCNGNFVNPAWHSGSSTIATSGAAFVRGAAWESFRNNLFVAQLKQSDLRRFSIINSGRTARQRATYFNEKWGRLRAVVLGPKNKLWITTSNGSNDRIVRITPQ